MDDQAVEVIPETTSENDAVLLARIEEMIKTHLAQIDSLAEEITKYKDMVDDVLANDETYQEHDKLAKEAARVKSNTKKEIMKRVDVADFANKLKSLKSEQKELKGGLSDYLREYQRLSGSNQIEGEDGEFREIVFVAKLVKRSPQFKPR
ncbi:hypothetical protein A3J19_02185 [Candidatus Daviesbacteria bacterium RIFCSPLOWO2_02_FULL_41_8]|uniref:Uncharacterized protein n=3 Tax=Candidatus Daviesiibacteriota TaxID=1752718 RepID=A0A1F5NHK0_9BACT|nr:MAG: hypothetical protein A2871_01185 [Candidatus Daviesbacteria bacterium RIFCSPHIGHO2_01_FULL_41_23]OGE32657.1 MAG: hypothetical protein A3D83_01550 [Candidatus Daviesbacteria bacterium RIFCSPHIGHO2_02_FULL_41_10]OGE62509.1 MAG: hypothetical protein A2967_01670 [Candidatus Daviesbacteria bacterium RIFCSPLOWO2_01_FULL_41_32]OGE77105.1 MAG: hypothetical protein A3J19_02185 [Candidatus Daviesbacteria bacterium RIFCSPLOWO2_02_FULL_41_8]